MHIACTRKLASQSPISRQLISCIYQALQDNTLRIVAPSSSRAKFRECNAFLQKSYAFALG
jgi:hypothetical protein